MLELVAAHHIKRQQHVGNPGIRHHFRLAEFLDSNPLGAKFYLRQRQRHQLMGLDMRTVGKTHRIASRLPAAEISRDHVDVDDRNRGFDILKARAHVFELEMFQDINGAHTCMLMRNI